jgi:aquaporin Z
MGVAVGGTVIAISITPWGKRSGGHFNPAITFTFYRLGKMEFWDAAYYVVAQFAGGIGGVAIAAYVLRGALGDGAVRYAVTVPGFYGDVGAFVAELTISFLLMFTLLLASNRATLAQFTPYLMGVQYATYITFETPFSGMSMNPARTLGSAVHAGYWHAIWIYFTAPTLGMLIAGEIFLRIRRGVAPCCAKLHHAKGDRCTFVHTYQQYGS